MLWIKTIFFYYCGKESYDKGVTPVMLTCITQTIECNSLLGVEPEISR